MAKTEDRGRLRLDALPQGLYRVQARHGFTEQPNAPDIIARCRDRSLEAPTDDTTDYLSRPCAPHADELGGRRSRVRSS